MGYKKRARVGSRVVGCTSNLVGQPVLVDRAYLTGASCENSPPEQPSAALDGTTMVAGLGRMWAAVFERGGRGFEGGGFLF
jgi:hypothetical protein